MTVRENEGKDLPLLFYWFQSRRFEHAQRGFPKGKEIEEWVPTPRPRGEVTSSLEIEPRTEAFSSNEERKCSRGTIKRFRIDVLLLPKIGKVLYFDHVANAAAVDQYLVRMEPTRLGFLHERAGFGPLFLCVRHPMRLSPSAVCACARESENAHRDHERG